jgi:hypothetical protein
MKEFLNEVSRFSHGNYKTISRRQDTQGGSKDYKQ